MPMKSCHLADIRSLVQFYDEVARQLDFPDHFGRNLDALWDVLTNDIEGPLEIVWQDTALSQAAMGDDYAKLVALLEEVAEERDDMALKLLPSGKQKR
jgi:ribonuclease inhibitor